MPQSIVWPLMQPRFEAFVLVNRRNIQGYFYGQDVVSFWRGVEFELLPLAPSEYDEGGNSYEKLVYGWQPSPRL